MRVLLISTNTEQINMPAIPLGLMYVAEASKRSGHEVELLDLMFRKDLKTVLQKRIMEFEPDIIGISVRNIDDQNLENPEFLLAPVRHMIDWCRDASSAAIILGGAGFSIFPGEVLKYLNADMGVCGEGERIFPLLLECIDSGGDPSNIPGVHIRGRGNCPEQIFVPDLNVFSFPEENAWENIDPNYADTWIPVETRRGCPNLCSYCSTFRIQGCTVRIRSPILVARYMERLVGLGFKQFYIVDNSFNIPEVQGIDICNALSERGLKIGWKAILYPHGVSEKLIESMKEAGCIEVALGFESGCDFILKKMNKRFGANEVKRTCRMLADYGIRRIGFLLLGGPGETRDSVEESLEFANSLDLEGLRTTVGIRIYPGTLLEKRALEEGIINPEDNLLLPNFYIAPEVDPWIRSRVTAGFRLLK